MHESAQCVRNAGQAGIFSDMIYIMMLQYTRMHFSTDIAIETHPSFSIFNRRFLYNGRRKLYTQPETHKTINFNLQTAIGY